ncbi:5-formyltetrahydrofolate cyclo-ligase [bacterium HR39]|nr:5-formyltetrahydrofolate cyclo-ligase [bacterium HR39]
MVVLPVLGVGPRGQRLGYGGGYYDRTLAVLRPRPLVIGVGHDFVRLAALPVGAHDQPLDLLVTPGSAIAFSDRLRRRDVRAR